MQIGGRQLDLDLYLIASPEMPSVRLMLEYAETAERIRDKLVEWYRERDIDPMAGPDPFPSR
jgi:hypothetical protein